MSNQALAVATEALHMAALLDAGSSTETGAMELQLIHQVQDAARKLADVAGDVASSLQGAPAANGSRGVLQ